MTWRTGRDGLVHLTTPRMHSITAKHQGRNPGKEPRGRNWSWDMEEHCLLAFSLWHSQFGLFYRQDQPAKDDTADSELDPLTPITNHEHVPQTCSQANLIETIPQLKFHLPKWQATLAVSSLHKLASTKSAGHGGLYLEPGMNQVDTNRALKLPSQTVLYNWWISGH